MTRRNDGAPGGAEDGTRGPGGELHQEAGGGHPTLTTNQGIPVSDTQSSLKAGARGPTLLEDYILREKITHFDHERIPERVVHARGAGAHGYFEVTHPLADVTRAHFLAERGRKTPVFVRFSTVVGSLGSKDTPRDVRGFAVKFYTDEGNHDLVGNNIPVFFIQDAIKFPDLVHAVKPEPDRDFPQAASAHDTFWDFASLTTESTHMLLWVMSDRALPRSFRMMEGFGVHTFRLVGDGGESTFVKFHWRPHLGAQSTTWDEAVKIGGADPDYLRRDLWESIARGDYPRFDLHVQLFDAATARGFDFDVLDPTKVIPEEIVPLRMVGTLTLDRNPENIFAETEQVAFCPANVAPGVDFTDDPLLQGRLFSYLDTQLTRLGGPNFHEIPINRPRCPYANHQRDGFMRQANPRGRVAYEPSSLDPGSAREDPRRGFRSHPATDAAPERLRVRPESFADHYSQARLFWESQTAVEQDHIVSAFVFELSKVETVAVRERMVGNLARVAGELASRVARGLGLAAPAPAAPSAPVNPSPALSILARAAPTLRGRCVGALVADGTDGEVLQELRAALAAEGARLELVAPRVSGVHCAKGNPLAIDHQLGGAPSALFDAVAVLLAEPARDLLANHAAVRDFVADAWGHCKVIGVVPVSRPLLVAAGAPPGGDDGVVPLGPGAVADFVRRAKAGRAWAREASVRPAP
ncbi:MAG: catalase [Polyangiales bacterium]